MRDAGEGAARNSQDWRSRPTKTDGARRSYRRQFSGAHAEVRSAAQTLGLFARQYVEQHARMPAPERAHRLQQIAHSVADIVAELDLALREQSTASSEVARRVEEIAAHTEQTSGATAQSVSSAEALDSVADDLLKSIRRFET